MILLYLILLDRIDKEAKVVVLYVQQHKRELGNRTLEWSDVIQSAYEELWILFCGNQKQSVSAKSTEVLPVI